MAALGLFLTFLVLVAACESFYLQTRNPVATLTVSNGGKWGVWRGVSFCPQGSFAVGYNVKVNFLIETLFRMFVSQMLEVVAISVTGTPLLHHL